MLRERKDVEELLRAQTLIPAPHADARVGLLGLQGVGIWRAVLQLGGEQSVGWLYVLLDPNSNSITHVSCSLIVACIQKLTQECEEGFRQRLSVI